MVFIRHTDGPAVYAEKSRPQPLTPSQAINCRNSLWLHASTVGMFDPRLGCSRRHSVSEIADIWGVYPSTVRDGIKSALRLPTAEARDE